MAGFNTTIVWVRHKQSWVSICHLYKFQYNDCLGSSTEERNIIIMLEKFQYNDCLGSSNDGSKKEGHSKSFNTTIVWVRHNKE